MRALMLPLLTALLFLSPWASASATDPAAPAAVQETESSGGNPELSLYRQMEAKVDSAMGSVNAVVSGVLFKNLYDFVGGGGNLPFIVAWLVVGATLFTVYMGFINIRGFKHALEVVRGKYDDPSEAGEVTHFQALSSALSGTVGLGNIAGVAIAVSLGGPGATFWMIVAGLLGMSSKFVECTLGQMYREVDDQGRVLGGPMRYLHIGLQERGLGGLGKVLSLMFAVLCIGGSFGGGNMFQVKQSLGAVQATVPFLVGREWIYGLVMCALASIVIIGGIKRIGATAEKIVPFMCGVYVLAALVVLVRHFTHIPAALGTIISGAFSPEAAYGGVVGVLVVGFQRAAFSNEAGAGSASIAHSAAKTEEPVREGIVALLEPFIDTVIVCTMTALVIVITGAYDAGGAFAEARAATDGARLTSLAFEGEISWFPYVLSVAVMLFAFSTIITWSYYGERCWTNLFGERSSIIYKVIFIVFIFLGAIISAQNVLDFSDLMILGMALPNIIGLYFLAPRVKAALVEYWRKKNAGEFKTFK